MELKKISRYFPDEMPYGECVQYFRSEDGQDFYESLDKFTRKYKLCVEPDSGIIRAISEDVSTLYPVGFTVVDVDTLPDGFDIYGNWVFNGKTVVPRVLTKEELIAQAEYDKARLMAAANAAITPLQYAVDLGEATEEENTLLLAWKKYIIKLNRVDTSIAPVTEWPVVPV